MSTTQSTQNVQPPPTGSQNQQNISSSVVLKSLSFLLGIFFIFIGIMKITPYFSKDLHKDLRKEYVKYSKVFPLVDLFDIKIPSKWYRRIVGGLEVGSGFVMAAIPNQKIKNAGNITLLVLMLLSIYNQWMVSDAFERIGPTLVFTFMLTGRLVVWYQISRREAKINAAAQAQANGLKQD